MVDDPFWGNLFHRRRRGEDQLYDILSEIPIFRDLSRRDFARLEGILHRRSYAPGEAIVTEDQAAARRWVAAVDAAAVLVNASTRFTDGGELGFGAEIGISTQKLHARGPMGLPEMTSTKYVVTGDGHVR